MNEMNGEIKILKTAEEPLLKRKIVDFEVSHGASTTPKRSELKSKLSILLGAEENLLAINGFRTTYGLNKTFGQALVYGDAASMLVSEGKVKVQKEKEGKNKKAAPAQAK
ncbi:MAG: hypothetical protein V1820_05545 [archaeon]